MRVSWLDVKLGLRMLARYPWLSAVAVIGMALAIAIGAGYFAIIGLALDSTLPVDGGDRIVTIEARTVAGPDAGRRERVLPRDFAEWRAGLKSISDLGAFRDETRNLITADGRTDVVKVAAITATAFRLMHATPVIGRTLIEDDERPGAAPVLVVGYDQWQRQFDGDPRVIGTLVRLDGRVHTIVGVMPEGFLFPVRHQYWAPLSLAGGESLDEARLLVFGRIADGFSMAAAGVELASVSEQMALAFPERDANVRLQPLRYTQAFTGIDGPREVLALRSFQLGAGILLLIVAVNVAILVYARTATRTGEVVVRTALGASRSRIVLQFFVEALVLTLTSAALGLGIVAVAFGLIGQWVQHAPHLDQIPYWWFQTGLSVWAVLYVVSFAVIAAVIVGVVPALQATGRTVYVRLQQVSTRGAGMQLGRLWTTLIVVQVASAVVVLPAAMYNVRQVLELAVRAPAAAASDMLRGTVLMASGGSSPDALTSRSADVPRLLQRLEAEPEVAAVTFARDVPGRERYATFDAEQAGQIVASSTEVATNLFDVFDVPILAGRGFVAADARPGATSVIVDRVFADALAAGANVVGRRVRYLNRARNGGIEFGSWLEIVGVVPAFASSFSAPPPFASQPPRLYHAAAPGQTDQTALMVRIRGGDPRRFAQRLRSIAASVNPALKLQGLVSVTDAWNYDSLAPSIAAFIILGVTGSVLLLSGAGIYSMMSFAVASRRREIGIRAALGADARRVLAGIFGRAIAQLGAGVGIGLSIAAGLEWLSGGALMNGQGLVLLPAVTGVMVTVGLLAALGPARRGLAVQPTEALRAD